VIGTVFQQDPLWPESFIQTYMRLFILFLALGDLTVSAQTTLTGTIQSGGLTREYRLYVPAGYNGATPVPLVFNLHGFGSNNLEQQLYSNFMPIADTAGFLIALPNGTLDNSGLRFWNTLGSGSQVDDVGFISDLLDTIRAAYNVDVNRVYSTGMSNGGFMSYELACQLAGRITAVASVTGSMTEARLSSCEPDRPVPVMEIHGTADPIVPYSGSAFNNIVPIPSLVAAWVDLNDCSPDPVVTPVPNTASADGSTATRFLYPGGSQGSTVEHFRVEDGGHTWPGASFIVGVTNQDFSASREIWRFFRQYRLDELTTAVSPVSEDPVRQPVFPNPVGDKLTLPSGPGGRIRAFDRSGRLVGDWRSPEGAALEIDTAAWENGLYYLLLENGGRTERFGVVKTSFKP
jgi:polyhydroxybutyrate depolymerase